MATLTSYPTDKYSGTIKGLSSASYILIGETFTPDAKWNIESVDFYLGIEGASGDVTAKIYATSGGAPTGSALATSTARNANTFAGSSSSLALETFTFSTPFEATSGTKYFICLEKNNAGTVYFGADGNSPTYPGELYGNTGSWNLDDATDCIFYVYGTAAASNTGSFFALF